MFPKARTLIHKLELTKVINKIIRLTIYVTEKIIWGINDILLEFLQMCFACFELVNVTNEHEAFQMFNGYSIYLEIFLTMLMLIQNVQYSGQPKYVIV